MPRAREKKTPLIDVLVLGEHPASYLAAALLREKPNLRILHATLPQEENDDRLVLVNPAFFSLHKWLEPLRRKMEMSAVYGMQFLGEEPETRSEHRAKGVMAQVTSLQQARGAVRKVAEQQGVEFLTPKCFDIVRLDEAGVEVSFGKQSVRARMMILGGILEPRLQQMLGLPESWGAEVMHRYTYLRLRAAKWLEPNPKPLVSMSLDLKKRLQWAWLLPMEGQFQLAVEQTSDGAQPVTGKPYPAPPDAVEALRHWAGVLQKHGVLKAGTSIGMEQAESIDLPLAGALAHEGVANRTLLIGPAGGFYSATGEDLYPNCWSALFAVEVARRALKEPHLQDALHPYRQRWRTDLGEYLRGPRQNLRFLLPLVYRNRVMTQRLAEAIVLGKGLVR